MSKIQKVSANILSKLNTSEDEAPKKRSSREMREEWKKSIEEIDFDIIEKLDDAMTSYVTDFMIDRVETGEARILEQDEINKLAREHKSYKTIVDALESRRQQIRTMIFNHLNVTEEESGNEDEKPIEYLAGAVKTDEGVTFKREGGNMKDPSIDTDKLEGVLGEDLANSLFDEVVIPEQREQRFNEERFMAKVDSGEISLEQVREVLKNNGYNTPKFMVR